jgi:hypothetical protein
MKLLLAGSFAALTSIAIHNFGDGFIGHAPNSLLWLFAGLIVTIARQIRTEQAQPASAHGAVVTP